MDAMHLRVEWLLAQAHRVPTASPLSEYALDNAGNVAVALPDELEPRCRRFGVLTLQGALQPAALWRGETMRILRLDGSARSAVGTTGESLYLFHDNQKERLPLERRGTWENIALCGSGDRFAATMQDLFGGTGALIYGRVAEGNSWVRETTTRVVALSIARSGSAVATADAAGEVVLRDERSRVVWRHWVDDVVVALAILENHRCLVALQGSASRGPAVLVIDYDGACAGQIPLPATALRMASDAQGNRFVVQVGGDGETSKLVFGNGSGDVLGDATWREPSRTGIRAFSMASDGEWLAIQTESGDIFVGQLGDVPDGRLKRVEARVREADQRCRTELPVEQLRWLRDQCLEYPGEESLWQRYDAAREEAIAQLDAGVATDLAVDDPEQAWRKIMQSQDGMVDDPTVCSLRSSVLDRLIDHRVSICVGLEQSQNWEECWSACVRVLEILPWDQATRQRIARCERSLAAQCIDSAGAALANGDYPACRRELALADRYGASSEISGRILWECRIREALQQADAAYSAKNYPAAAFLYRKVLEWVPDHADAERKLQFALGLLGDTDINDRFSRLE